MGIRERTEVNEKEELVVGEIDAGWSPISPIIVNAGIVPTLESHDDTRTIPIPDSHIDARTVPILESRVETGTIRVHASMSTRDQTP